MTRAEKVQKLAERIVDLMRDDELFYEDALVSNAKMIDDEAVIEVEFDSSKKSDTFKIVISRV